MIPSAVQISALVVGLKHCPAPPEARITFLAAKVSMLPGADVARDDADAAAVVIDDQRRHEPLLEALDRRGVLHQLLVEHVQDRLAGDVGDVGGALHRGAAERAQVKLAGVVAVEGDADVLEVHHLAGRLAAHHLDRVLVAEEVRALDGVVGVRAPIVGDADRGVDAAGGRHRVRAHRVDLAHDRDRHPFARRGEGRALAGQAGADDQYVMFGHRFLGVVAGDLLEAGLYSAADGFIAARTAAA